jgi:hypothetical protein
LIGPCFAVIAEEGQKWGQIGPAFSASHAQIATNSSGGLASGPSLFADKFFAFKFNKGTTSSYKFKYGWLKANLTNQNFSNLFLHIDSYAYDDSGTQIAMGDTGVPEPASGVQLAALAAMTLGAVGVRRWKAAKHAAKASAGDVA